MSRISLYVYFSQIRTIAGDTKMSDFQCHLYNMIAPQRSQYLHLFMVFYQNNTVLSNPYFSCRQNKIIKWIHINHRIYLSIEKYRIKIILLIIFCSQMLSILILTGAYCKNEFMSDLINVVDVCEQIWKSQFQK